MRKIFDLSHDLSEGGRHDFEIFALDAGDIHVEERVVDKTGTGTLASFNLASKSVDSLIRALEHRDLPALTMERDDERL